MDRLWMVPLMELPLGHAWSSDLYTLHHSGFRGSPEDRNTARTVYRRTVAVSYPGVRLRQFKPAAAFLLPASFFFASCSRSPNIEAKTETAAASTVAVAIARPENLSSD